MRLLFLHRLLYKFLQWGGHADARPTEFAATVIGADRPGLDHGPGNQQPQGSSAQPESPLEPAVTQIGRYLVRGRLGSGGLGEVLEAWDPLLSRAVAVKTLRLQPDAELRALLDKHILNEARAAARLSHPNIVTVFDAGLCAQGVYIAMERLHGRDLHQALATGWRPTPWQAAQVACHVAEALAYAHAKGVVHCDIKPANIFLDQDDRPKVLDFGIARVAQDHKLPGAEDPLFGSPHYLAPEQLQHGVADARTDIRALGVVLYEMLTGRMAFAGDTVEQVINAVLCNHPAPAHEIRGGVPRALSTIAAKAMSRDPQQRFANAQALVRELREWSRRHAEAATGAPARKGRAAQRSAATARRKASTAWALAALLLCVAAAGWLWWLPSGNPGPGLAQGPVQAQARAAATVAAISSAAALVAPAVQQAADSANQSPAARASSDSGSPRAPAGKAGTATAAGQRSQAGDSAVGSGDVLLSISPWGQVEVNGLAAGTTPPLSRLTLPAGRHTITVRNEDFPIYTTTVVVQADKPALVRHRFVP